MKITLIVKIMRYHTNAKGDFGKLKIIEDLIEKGFFISLPFQENLPYDIIAHNPNDNKIHRIQCKYISNPNSQFANDSVYGYKENDFDYYALYLADKKIVIYPSIKFKSKKIRTAIPNSPVEYYWYEDFLTFTDEASKRKNHNVDWKTIATHRNIDYSKQEKIDWPLKEELEKLVWAQPLSKLSKELKVSDVSIKKRCLSLGITLPAQGYWNKRK